MQKPSIPRGTRDFSPEEMVKRNYIFQSIRTVFSLYGYAPIETPSMENLTTLMGKYGEEGDRLIFKILPRGEKLNMEAIKIEEALRYDLTVPFARYVVQHQNEIAFPFRRYQIQPVWRADRPAKGRYREFYQCDADVIGSDSLLNELELVQMIDQVFSKLNVPVRIKINNRKILSGIAEVIGEKEKIVDITVAIDKLDKIGVDGVNKELREKQISESAIGKLQPLIEFSGDTAAKLNLLRNMLQGSETGNKGIAELEYLFTWIGKSKLSGAECELDITLARGLNYYTGAIFEVKANAGTFTSSICGGGRYDDLTGIFGLPNVSGVGISFGADRIYDVMSELNLFPQEVMTSTKLMFAHFGEAERDFCLPLLAQARQAGISSELYPDVTKIKKQLDYANRKGIPFVAVVGSDEMKDGMLSVKNMVDGSQLKLKIYELIDKLKS
ncbi:MAG TPA: histidine--tRNA ligase [Bacteroidia bacterium]|nr:histidine--tRNA ligase [Bacteroidia bacterium]